MQQTTTETHNTYNAYNAAKIVRTVNGIPRWMDRVGALGNAVVPQIPMLIGAWIKNVHLEHNLTLV